MRKFELAVNKLKTLQNRITIFKFLLLAVSLILVFTILFYGIFIANTGRLPQFYLALTLKVGLVMLLLFISIKCLRSLIDLRKAAQLLDKSNHDIHDTYLSAWELLHLQKDSSELIELVLHQADDHSAQQTIKADYSPLQSIWQLTAALAALLALIFIIDTSGLTDSIKYFRHMKLPAQQHKQFVEVYPGNLSITRGAELWIEALNPEPDIANTLLWKRDKIWREEILQDYKKRFNNLDYSFDYYIKTPYAVSDTFRIDVFELPVIKQYDLKYEFPQYTGLKSEIIQDASGQIKALAGSIVTLDITANNPVDTARTVFNDGTFLNMIRKGKSSFSSSFSLENSGSYHINIFDFLGNQNKRVEKNITAVPDEFPQIKITWPARDTLIDQNMLLPLEMKASDDYGLKNLKLKFHINEEAPDSIMIQKNIQGTNLEMEYIFELSDIWLLPGDRLYYWLQITDNTPWAQTSRSKKFVARFPSISEIYEEIESQEEAKSDLLQKMSQESDLLQKDFEEKRRELMKKEEYDWEDKKDLENLMQKQQELSENVDDMAESYRDLVEKMQNNQALSQETLQKMEKIQELMEEISGDELKEAMEEMTKAMENMDPEVMQKAMENLKFSMEDFSQQIDQTLQLLEDIKKEQTMQKALQIAQEMEKMQADLNQRSQDGSENAQKLADEQAAQQQRLQDLQKQLDAASELMDPQKDSKINEQLQNLMESGLMDSLASDINNASSQLQKQQNQNASQSQQNAMAKMQKLRNKLQNMSSMMSMSGSMQIGQALDEAIRSLIFMSSMHQDIITDFGKDPFRILPDLISEQEGINLTLQKLYAVPMIVLALGPKFVYDLNYTMSQFRELFQYINDAKSTKVDDYLEDLQKGINLMIYDLMQSSQNMQQGGAGGSGMQSLMQQLQQMSQQQMAMNMMTQQLFQQMAQNGRPSQDMLSEMQRLAAEEQRIAENLKRTLQNNPEAQKQASALNQMIEDLEGISRNLKRGKINQDLIDTQNRILSRLLDAQKSIHKRDFSKKRKAENSEFLLWDTPEEIKLKFDKLRQKALLEENYENFPSEYQELIREYLKELNSN